MATDESQIRSLKTQHDIWLEDTQKLITYLHLKEGMKVADLGCGPGFLTVREKTSIFN